MNGKTFFAFSPILSFSFQFLRGVLVVIAIECSQLCLYRIYVCITVFTNEKKKGR